MLIIHNTDMIYNISTIKASDHLSKDYSVHSGNVHVGTRVWPTDASAMTVGMCQAIWVYNNATCVYDMLAWSQHCVYLPGSSAKEPRNQQQNNDDLTVVGYFDEGAPPHLQKMFVRVARDSRSVIFEIVCSYSWPGSCIATGWPPPRQAKMIRCNFVNWGWHGSRGIVREMFCNICSATSANSKHEGTVYSMHDVVVWWTHIVVQVVGNMALLRNMFRGLGGRVFCNFIAKQQVALEMTRV